MYRNKTFNRKKVMIVFVAVFFIMMFLIGRLVYLMIFCSEYYGNKAENLHERERDIKAARGKLLDANGTVLATNKSVCTISVIHNQMEEPEKVIAMLVKELGISEETARKRVEKVSSIERVKTNVAKETGDAIRAYGLSGVKLNEDYREKYSEIWKDFVPERKNQCQLEEMLTYQYFNIVLNMFNEKRNPNQLYVISSYKNLIITY